MFNYFEDISEHSRVKSCGIGFYIEHDFDFDRLLVVWLGFNVYTEFWWLKFKKWKFLNNYYEKQE